MSDYRAKFEGAALIYYMFPHKNRYISMNPVTRKEGIYLARDPFTMMFDGFLSFEQTLR